ncbi:Rep protein CDS [Salmonella enterica subsp. enterica serovar Derby]|nr:Rep protein CDS [Salmonella enterica subsp. enterica serovar Derby]
MWVLLFDVDHPLAAMAWDAAGLPPPTWTAQNPENGHAHIAYALSAPVAKSDAARLKPLRLLARIQHAMTDALSADRGYVGLITKTPNHARWRTTVWRPEPYGGAPTGMVWRLGNQSDIAPVGTQSVCHGVLYACQ